MSTKIKVIIGTILAIIAAIAIEVWQPTHFCDYTKVSDMPWYCLK